MALSLYQLVTASILIVVGVILLGWRLGKERTRPEAITTIGALCLVCAGSFLVSWMLTSPEPANWEQSVVYTIRAIPYDAGLIALSYFLIRSIGYKYPRTQVVLSYSPTVFGLCWITAFFFAFLVNVPALEEYGHFPPEFLLLKLRNIPELVWPALTAVVFARELIQGGEPSIKLRVQHASFLVACLGFVGLSAAAMWVNYLKVMVDPAISTDNQVSLMLTVESVALAVAGIGWICGAILDDSSEEANKLADEIESWIEIRHELEAMIDQELGGYLSGGRGIVGTARMIDTFDHANSNLDVLVTDFSRERQEESEKLLHLLWVLYVEPRRKELISRLRRSQEQLASNRKVGSRLLVKLDSKVSYDVASDPLFRVVNLVLELQEEAAVWQTFHHWTLDHQLSLMVAADIGLLQPELNKAIKLYPSRYLTVAVIFAYERAKDTRESG